MDDNIKQILTDLYQLDPALKINEPQIIQILNVISKNKPEPILDEAFVSNLKQKLLLSSNFKSDKSLNSSFNFMKSFKFTFSALAVCLLLIAGGYLLSTNSLNKTSKISFNNNLKISNTQEHAFGKLDKVTLATGLGGGTADANQTSKENLNLAAPMSSPSAQAIGIGGGGGINMPVYDFPTYNYVYKGEDLKLVDTKRQVLKRVKGQDALLDIGGLLNNLSFGLVDLNSFANLRLQSVSFVQNDPEGYNIYVNVDEASININGAWPGPLMEKKSDAVSQTCLRGTDCGAYQPITIGDIPPDTEIIAISNAFVSSHNIPTAAYGTPEVRNDWRVWYEAAPDKTNYYLPEAISVIYPIQIDGQYVYDEGGNKTGLSVSVNIRNKKVVGVWDLTVQSYQSSMYEAETDLDRIMKIVTRGGMYSYSDPNAKRVVEVELGDPTIQFVKMWNYNNNKSEELLIPSLVFPVLKAPVGEQYFKQSVIVPLIKEILDLDNNGGPINIMPMTGEAGSASSNEIPPVK